MADGTTPPGEQPAALALPERAARPRGGWEPAPAGQTAHWLDIHGAYACGADGGGGPPVTALGRPHTPCTVCEDRVDAARYEAGQLGFRVTPMLAQPEPGMVGAAPWV